MSQNKLAYFQGGGHENEPTPKKKRYKSDTAIVVQPRFEEPFYRNYDLYDTDGKTGPGAGWHHMHKYKSISEFLKDKRKRLKDRYKANDSWIQDDGRITKEPQSKRASRRLRFLKIAIDFPSDNLNSDPMLGNSGTYGDSEYIRSKSDSVFPLDDEYGRSADELDFASDTDNITPDRLIDLASQFADLANNIDIK